MQSRALKKVFIANRGEIARRIAESAQKMGIQVAAIHSGDMPPAFLTDLVDHWYQVEEESPATYLDGAGMIRIAKELGCDAVHPGFGFLSENAQFAREVVDAGMIWIGPGTEAILAMASKASARQLAEEHKVPCVPGCQLAADTDPSLGVPNQVERFVSKNGLPVLIKAALGGGGKGMRVVRDMDNLATQIQRAASEAHHAFGDGSLIVESYLENPRHVEIQILADQHGQVITVGDRDCSLQRRHQKIIEEAPAPNLHPQTREAMHQAARRLAEAVGYTSAGTVEFLVDGSSHQVQRFFFLEMNTRLQVEHPVTEQVYQIDLVEWQLRVAMGEELPTNLVQDGAQRHSIEARIYAEDPERDFFPAPGPVFAFIPAQGAKIRWEPGIDGIDEITPKFDPMIAKVIATGESREEAIQNLRTALNQTVYCGPPANIEFLSDILAHPDFRDGKISTFYLSRHFPELLEQLNRRKSRVHHKLEPILDELHQSQQSIDFGQVAGHTGVIRNCFQSHGESRPSFHLKNPQRSAKIPGSSVQLGTVSFFLDGKHLSLPLTRIQTPDHDAMWVLYEGFSCHKTWVKESQASAMQRSLDSGSVLAPVPGRVVKVFVEEGQQVKENQTLVILESMKMEFEVKSPQACSVKTVHTQANLQVQADDLLVSLELTE